MWTRLTEISNAIDAEGMDISHANVQRRAKEKEKEKETKEKEKAKAKDKRQGRDRPTSCAGLARKQDTDQLTVL